MIWLLGLIFLLALLSRLRLGVGGGCSQEGRGFLWLRLGKIKFYLLPRKNKKTRKTKKPEKLKNKKNQESASKNALQEFGSRQEIFQLVLRLLPMLGEAGGKFRRKLRVDRLRLCLLVGAEDPADAARLYGWANVILGGLWGPLTEGFHVADGRAHIQLDFDRKVPALYGDCAASMTLGQLCLLGLWLGPRALGLLLELRKNSRDQDRSKHGQEKQRKAA